MKFLLSLKSAKSLTLVAATIATAIASSVTPSQASQPTSIIQAEATQIPKNLQVPTGQKLLLKAAAEGTQIYTCRQVTDKESQYEWALKAPDAQLFDARREVLGKHYAGPTWEANDGSKIAAVVIAKAIVPDSIPLLLLQVKSAQGRGILINVSLIQRLNTTGGNPPQLVCNQDRQNTELAVPYTADYYFYGTTKRGNADRGDRQYPR
jgi:Protein of unknown function (DUF3455)